MIRSIHTQIIVLDMCATNARYLRTEISCQPSGRFELVVTLRCSVVHIQNFAIKISASETGAESLQITYHLFRGTRHHESRMDRATGNRHGVWHENGRAGNKIITSFSPTMPLRSCVCRCSCACLSGIRSRDLRNFVVIGVSRLMKLHRSVAFL